MSSLLSVARSLLTICQAFEEDPCVRSHDDRGFVHADGGGILVHRPLVYAFE